MSDSPPDAASHDKPFELRHRPARGTAPGTLTCRADAHEPVVTIMNYDNNALVDQRQATLAELDESLARWSVTWVDVAGLADTELIQAIGDRFGAHPLALEDVCNLHQRPKVEAYDDSLFIITRMPEYRDGRLELEQLSIFLGERFIVTFQEKPGDCFGPVRDRIRRHQGSRDRLLRADYLCYALLDAVVDAYFPVLESLSDELDGIEDAAVGRPSSALVREIYSLKRDLQALRRTVWPQRELFRSLMRDLSPVSDETRIYLRDCEDHAVQIMDVVETYRERASSALDLYVTSINHRMNEVMKVLTIMATVFMPLTVITGIYGMNFDTAASPWNMPELGWAYGYPFALGLLLTVAGGLLIVFKRRGWIGPLRRRRRRRNRVVAP